MLVRIWGCRGSLASPGASKVRYGGDTSCVEVRLDDGTLIVLDAGTGIREFGVHLDGGLQEVHLLLTHLHIDHVEGLPFFPSLWNPDVDVHVWGPPSPVMTLRERIARYMSPPLFPIDIHDVPGACIFHDLPTDPWTIGTATLTALSIEHPGPTVGYRLEADGASMAYMPDHEPAILGNLMEESPEWIDGFAIAREVDVLMHDSQYTPEEYEARRGWGHSSYVDAIAYAHATGAKQLIMFHHDPTHNDTTLEAMEHEAASLWVGTGPDPRLAAAGMTLHLTAAPVRHAASE